MKKRSGIATWALFVPLLAGSFYILLIEQRRPLLTYGGIVPRQTLITLFLIAAVLVALIVYYTFQNVQSIRIRQKQERLAVTAYKTLRVELQKKDDFISIASHELKTPLTTLKIYIQALQNFAAERGDSDYAPFLEKVDQQASKLNDLVENLLDIARIEGAKMRYVMRPFDLDALMRACAEDSRIASEQHEIRISGQVGIPVYGDRDRIAQVITNLLTNAVKYSPDMNVIDVSLALAGARARVDIRDYGIGIPRDKQAKIFEKFYRVTEGVSFPGMGVGLYISAQIVAQHGGRLEVKSEPGNGSTFSFTLPLGSSFPTEPIRPPEP
ncbi:MAG TPA: HAMP domain-containing sensor histidine kinase [Candidatus Paceibacterota bacterium]|nr:HAMP domain-containing sensor histidine kinase [Candidatus Paceibacterota bacterium]